MSFSLIHCSQLILHANQLNLRPIGYSGNSEYDLVNYDCCHNAKQCNAAFCHCPRARRRRLLLVCFIMINHDNVTRACVSFEWFKWNITCYVVIKVLSLTLFFNPFGFLSWLSSLPSFFFLMKSVCRDIRNIILLANSPKLLLRRSLPSSPDSRLRVPVIIAWWLPFIFFLCFLFCFFFRTNFIE